MKVISNGEDGWRKRTRARKRKVRRGPRGWTECHRITSRACKGVNCWMAVRISRKEASRMTKARRRCRNMVEKDKGEEEVDNMEEDDGKDKDEEAQQNEKITPSGFLIVTFLMPQGSAAD